jgi:hypothetical protein
MSSLLDSLSRHLDDSALDTPAPAPSPDGGAILGHILGDRRAVAEQGVANASGLDLLEGRSVAHGGTGGLMGMVAGLLDRDRDGSISDDLGSMLGGLLRRS